MRRATAVNLVLLGGGLTLVGAISAVNERRRTQACGEEHARGLSSPDPDCGRPRGGSGGGGGGGFHGGYGGNGASSYGNDDGHSSASEGGTARGGFGGSGGEGGGE